jgi:hypothetical protein
LVAALGELRSLADELCACTDPSCAHEVKKELHAWDERIYGDPVLTEIYARGQVDQLRDNVIEYLKECLEHSATLSQTAP